MVWGHGCELDIRHPFFLSVKDQKLAGQLVTSETKPEGFKIGG